MAGTKSPKVKDDRAKKRKRDIIEADAQSKRQRGEHKALARISKPTKDADGKVDDESAAITTVGDREIELIPKFDNVEAGWRLSKPMGGRMLDIDPILSEDERFLILAYNNSIQVYSAVDSLLVRRIPIDVDDLTTNAGSRTGTIVGAKHSIQDPDFVWVACSDGRVFHVNWTKPSEPQSFQTQSRTAKALAVMSVGPSSKPQDVVVLAESDTEQKIEVVAYDGDLTSTCKSKSLFIMQKPGSGLQLLECGTNSQVLVGAINDRLFLGAPLKQANSLAELEFEFYTFDTPDLISAIDLRVYPRSAAGKKAKSKSPYVVDIIVGAARGAIYLYHDALARSQSLGTSGTAKDVIQAQKFHWHRKAVHALKWSQDGNYMLSGGSENVFVLWQMDTGRRDYLPHLSGSIENIVVSANGASYVLHLDDNSTMIISTSEMKPTAYVSGIQSAAVQFSTPKDQLVRRDWSTAQQVRRPIPAAIRPTDSSKLHVCVGNGSQATMSGAFSAPLLQTFDLESFRSVTTQALTRTQLTDVNITSKGQVIDEPLITNVAFSADGKWLASVDTWEPSPQDLQEFDGDVKDHFLQERREVYLKFWESSQESEQVGLVSRINDPHGTNCTQPVLDLASSPAVACFATIGGDGKVRLWRPKPRLNNGVAVKTVSGSDAYTWVCSQVITVGSAVPEEGPIDLSDSTNKPEAPKPQGSIAFSEDGSSIFVAFGLESAGDVHVISTSTGEIVKTLEDQWAGQLHAIGVLSHFVAILSDELRICDVVNEESQSLLISKSPKIDDMPHLAIDPTSRHFAVALPETHGSAIAVYRPEDIEPLFVRQIPRRIVSLVSTPGTSGFIALDDAAQVWIIAEGSDPSALAAFQPLEDQHLDDIDTDNQTSIALLEEGNDEDEDEEMEGDEKVIEDGDVDMDEDYLHPSVVQQHQLTDIFDAAPAFAALSVEDMFYRVTGLLATKPLVA